MGKGGKGRGRGKGGEMTQTLYAHMNKIKIFFKRQNKSQNSSISYIKLSALFLVELGCKREEKEGT
jgi:hypothetical protein